jgi:Arm DNA-binding domain
MLIDASSSPTDAGLLRGSVYKRGSTWTWHVDVGVDPVTGKRRQQTKGGFKTKREC